MSSPRYWHKGFPSISTDEPSFQLLKYEASWHVLVKSNMGPSSVIDTTWNIHGILTTFLNLLLIILFSLSNVHFLYTKLRKCVAWQMKITWAPIEEHETFIRIKIELRVDQLSFCKWENIVAQLFQREVKSAKNIIVKKVCNVAH